MSSDNYLKRNRVVLSILGILSFSAWGLLALTSGVFSSAYMNNISIKLLGVTNYYLIGIGMLLFYFLIDFNNGTLVKKVALEKSDLNGEKLKVFNIKKVVWYIMIVFTIVRIAATTTTSLWAIPETAELIVSDSNDEYYFGLAKDKKEERDQLLTDLKRQKNAAISTRKKRIKKANTERGNLIRIAELKGDFWQKQGLKDGGVFNCWMCSNANRTDKRDMRYCESVKKAYVKGDSIVAKQKNIVAKIQDKIDKLISNGEYAASIREFERLGIEEKESHKTSLNNFEGILWIIEPLSALVGLSCSLLIALIGIAGKARRKKESVLQVWAEYKTMKHDELVNGLKDKLGLKELKEKIEDLEKETNEDLDGNGEIGTVDDKNLEKILAANPMSQNLSTGDKIIEVSMPIGKDINQPKTKIKPPLNQAREKQGINGGKDLNNKGWFRVVSSSSSQSETDVTLGEKATNEDSKDHSPIRVVENTKTHDTPEVKAILVREKTTIDHFDEKRQITLHYNISQVDSRVTNYERKVSLSKTNLDQAKSNNDKRMIKQHQLALNNRKRWLDYWSKKRDKLLIKMDAV